MKTIAIDVSQSVYHATGVARFTINFVTNLVNAVDSNDTKILLFFSSLNHSLPDELTDLVKARKDTVKIVRWLVPPRALSFIWSSYLRRIFSRIQTERIDLFISSDWAEPPAEIARFKATIVHDLIFKIYPETVDQVIKSAHERRLMSVSRECDLIFCDSQSTANDLKDNYTVRGKIVVNYPGVEPAKIAESIKLNKPKVDEKFFLSVGKIEPRKNIPLLVSAFEKYRSLPTCDAKTKLVIVGPRGWDVDANKLKSENVIFTGHVTDDELAWYYEHAIAFVYPTIYEGFGYPPLEAMHFGCPVIMSRTSSLVEIASPGSALFVKPNDENDLVNAMLQINKDADQRSQIIKNGYANVARFRWNKYIQSMLQSFEELGI
jgi:glycosyltransferase involved in cell wall biosynthesis